MSSQTLGDFVFVQLGGKRYGLPAAVVREVLQMLEPTPVPAWPAHALGLMDVRGELVPLVDCAPLLGLAPLKVSKDQFIVLLFCGERTWGLVVDAVEGVKTTALQEGRALAAGETFAIPALCHGICTEGGTVTVILEPDRLFEAMRLPGLQVPARSAEGRG